MTAELWLVIKCQHGYSDRGCVAEICTHQPGKHPKDEYGLYSECVCSGGSRVRLDPDKAVFLPPASDESYAYLIQDVIDALEGESS